MFSAEGKHIEQFRRSNVIFYAHDRKKCPCGAVIAAKLIKQQGGFCDKCVKASLL